MKLTLTSALLLTFALCAPAASLLCPSAVAPGAHIYATPNSTFGVCFEDLPAGMSDLDYNDQILLGSVDSIGTHATLTFYGADAAINDVLRYQGADLWTNTTHAGPAVIGVTTGAEIVLGLYAAGNLWTTGSIQAVVWQQGPGPGPEPNTSPVPEPGTVGLIGAGLVVVLWMVRRGA